MRICLLCIGYSCWKTCRSDIDPFLRAVDIKYSLCGYSMFWKADRLVWLSYILGIWPTYISRVNHTWLLLNTTLWQLSYFPHAAFSLGSTFVNISAKLVSVSSLAMRNIPAATASRHIWEAILWCFLYTTDSSNEEFLYTALLSHNMSLGPAIGTLNIWMSSASISN